MAKVMNPNAVNAMTIVNAKSQAKTMQMIQKIGRGKRKVQVTLSKGVRGYLSMYIRESKKEYSKYQNVPENVYSFLNYFEKETEITKENKKVKEKNIMLSFEELDYLKMNLKDMLANIEKNRKTLKWYEIKKKLGMSYTRKQSELALEELTNRGKSKEEKKKK